MLYYPPSSTHTHTHAHRVELKQIDPDIRIEDICLQSIAQQLISLKMLPKKLKQRVLALYNWKRSCNSLCFFQLSTLL